MKHILSSTHKCLALHQGVFVVIGGRYQDPYDPFVNLPAKVESNTTMSTERCTLNGQFIECTSVEPDLVGLEFFPEMIRVPSDYCSE